MPEIRTPASAAEDLSKLLKDAFYVTIGLGVIAVQRAQVRRQELTKQVSGHVDGLGKRVDDRVKTVEERLEAVEARFDALLDQLEERLPEQARDLAHQARVAAKEARTQVRGLARRTNGAPAA